MYKKILRSFVIGSSILVTMSEYNKLRNLINNDNYYPEYNKRKKFFIFYMYIVLAPLFNGFLNSLITYVRLNYNYNIHYIYFFFSIFLSFLEVYNKLNLKIFFNYYPVNINEWSEKVRYASSIFYKNIINWNFIIKSFELFFI